MTDDKKKQILARMQRYCALEDRSVQKVREKLYTIEGLSSQDGSDIIASLLEDHFLDDDRFVEAYVRSKINQNKWGRHKIKHGLIRHRISSDRIDHGLTQMNHESYYQNLKDLLTSRQKMSTDATSWIRYLTQKGYGYEEILEVMEK